MKPRAFDQASFLIMLQTSLSFAAACGLHTHLQSLKKQPHTRVKIDLCVSHTSQDQGGVVWCSVVVLCGVVLHGVLVRGVVLCGLVWYRRFVLCWSVLVYVVRF